MSRDDWQTLSERPLRGHVLLREDEEPGGPRLWRRLLMLLLVAGLIGGGLALYFTPILRVQEVQVTGAQTLDTHSLAELADLKGASMFTVPLDDAQERLAALPMIKSVKAERHWPHTIRLVVEERQPWAYWYTQEDEYVVDADGVVLEGTMPAPDALIIYHQDSSAQFQPGDIIDADAVQLARQLWDSLPVTLDTGLVRLEYNGREGLSLITDAGYRVIVGDGHGLEYKLAVWQALERKLGRQQMQGQVLDLRFGDRPSLR
ncbi:MAG: FtsQ-type POTRA domain-containing protein [Dehalococcoidia bacterium]|nr:MAG: FtsQ-type POTRA domain-containing protein [Dehalococcoidia bacterium]